MPASASVRSWLVSWLYLVAVGHFVIALGVTWWSDASWFAAYQQSILHSFGFPQDTGTLELQLWWISLFGATLQAFSLFMLALMYLANKHRLASIWLILAGVILLWAPQDIIISIQKNVWSHAWIDLAAIIALVPTLLILWRLDRVK
ncbi:MAG: hypothetical protein AAGC78_03655 [Cellvibrio sp.]|uniref:hypothetical protein n=1 Tax=Cellvibrio sp. TaxID=1965322 RepID=UPI0031B1EBAC